MRAIGRDRETGLTGPVKGVTVDRSVRVTADEAEAEPASSRSEEGLSSAETPPGSGEVR